MGLDIEVTEMKLLSFSASLETISDKGNQFVDERGRDHEEAVRTLFDRD